MSDNELDAELLALADEEEDDASAPGSPESLGSGAMEESESEADAEGEDDDDEGNPFPLEGKFKNEKDRAEIMAMTEVQREELLADRAAEQERRLQDLQLRKLLAQREKDEEAAKKKRKAGAAELDDSPHKSSRPKTKQSETLDKYRKAREARGKELERQRQRGRRRSGSGSVKSGSDRDAEGEDDADWDFGGRSNVPLKDDPPAELKDFNSCRIGRAGFAEVCFYPGFEDAITGSYCRMNSGPKEPGSDEYLYRMVLIKGFTTLPEKPYGPYLLEWNGKRYMTDQYVIGVEGKTERTVQFSHCSNSRITESELQSYKTAIQNAGMRMPTRSQLEEKFQNISHLRKMKFSNEDIQMKLAKQNKYAGRLAQSIVTSAPKPKTSAKVMEERLIEINRTNRRMNQEEGRKAMIAERKREMQRRAFAAKERERKEQEDAEKFAKETERKNRLAALGKDDLFDGSDVSRSGTPGISRSGTPLPPKRELKGIPTFSKKKMDDDVIASLDLDIDIEI